MDGGMNDKCRLCLSSDIIEESIFEPKEDDVSFSTKIMMCAGIMVAIEDGHPKYICSNCAGMLNLFFYLRKNWFKTYVSLNSTIDGIQVNNDILVENEEVEDQQDHNVVYENVKDDTTKLSKQDFLSSLNNQESDLGIDKVVSEEIVFDEEEPGRETFTERQFQVGCYVPVMEDGTEKEFPLLRRFRCTTCKNVFSSINDLDNHWEICGELVGSPEPIGDLMNTDTGDDIVYEDEMFESGIDDEGLTVQKKPNMKEFCCEVCGKIFKQLWLLTRHKQVKHVCERPYSCQHCPRKFFDKYELKYHQRLHQDIEDFCCNVCGRRFARRSGLRAHMRSHTGEKPFACTICGKSFAHLNSLTSHERLHTGERPYKCKYCSRTFAQFSTAKNHEEMHMGGLRLHQCEICDRMYKTEEDLRAHFVTHDGGSIEHHCVPCNKVFKKLLDLKKHNLRFHLEKSPYACSECDKSFMTSNELKNHATVHIGLPPFTCSFCSKTYKVHSLLQKHVEKHHKNQEFTIDPKDIGANNELNPNTISLSIF